MRTTDVVLALESWRAGGCTASPAPRTGTGRQIGAWTLPALERLAADADGGRDTRDEIVRRAAAEAEDLRDRVEGLASAEEELACRLHDTALQLLEFVGTDGFGATLERRHLAELLRRVAEEARRSVETPPRPDGDLDSALRAVTLEAQAMGLPPVTVSGRARRPVPAADVDAIAGAVREALTNVRKHAGASRVSVRVDDGPRELRVSVSDDGAGIDPARRPGAGRLGLSRSINGRVSRRGGRSLVSTTPGCGTHVLLALPAGRRA